MADTTRSGSARAEEPYPSEGGVRGSEQGGPSIAGLLQDIVGNIQGIIRSELRLAKAEVKEDVSTMVRAAAMLAVGAVLGVYALGIILLFVVYALRGPLPDWAAALIVGLVVAAVAGVLVMLGMQRIKSVNPAPEQTIDSIKEDVQWVKQQTR